MVATGTMIATSGYQAVSFASEAIHLVIRKIRERDLKVKKADIEVNLEKYNWTEILNQGNEGQIRNGTPGEDQEIRFKNSIIRRMQSKKHRRPTSIGTRRGYSLKINYGAERRTIGHMVKNYIKEMTKRNISINPEIESGFVKYSKAVDKVIKEDENRQKLIDIANSHISELIDHVRIFICKQINQTVNAKIIKLI